MKTPFYAAVCCFTLLPLVANVNAAELPKRKAGLWELTVTAAGTPPQVSKQCIDAATDAQMLQLGSQMSAQMKCAKNEMRKEGATYVTEGDCTFAGSRVQSSSVLKGDFTSQYEGVIKATFEPPMMGMKESTTKINAKWVGECGPEQKPGDIVMPTGVKMNINQLAAMRTAP